MMAFFVSEQRKQIHLLPPTVCRTYVYSKVAFFCPPPPPCPTKRTRGQCTPSTGLVLGHWPCVRGPGGEDEDEGGPSRTSPKRAKMRSGPQYRAMVQQEHTVEGPTKPRERAKQTRPMWDRQSESMRPTDPRVAVPKKI